MKFTDDTGQEWEEAFDDNLFNFRAIVIRPIKTEPKWEVVLVQNQINDDKDVYIQFNATQDQAQLIKEAVEALMEYINGGKWSPFDDAIRQARAAFRGKDET